MDKIIIKNGLVVTMNNKREIINSDILIVDNKISEISKDINVKDAKIIDASGKIIIPGLIQTHIHLTQSLFKGKADDLQLLDWLQNKIWPFEAKHTYESNYASSLIGIAELIKGGTTSIIDMETVNHTEAAFRAIKETGFRALVGKCMMDHGENVPSELMEDYKESLNEAEYLIKKYHKTANGRIEYALAPRFVVSCTEELLLGVKELSQKYNLMVHTHASENLGEISLVEKERGMRNIVYLDKLGLTGEKLVLAHCIHLDDEEMEILVRTKTKIVHCINSNLKLASGFAKIPELLEMGACVSLGADGAPCNNNLDMFREMRNAALIHKPRLHNPTIMNAKTVFEMATLGGADAMGKSSTLGSIEIGKLADIAILDLNNIYNPIELSNDDEVYSALVYSASSRDVTDTIIDGQIVMENRKLLTLDEKSILKNAKKVLNNF
jgi:5-methylthioadenosine/S-adenosylhomocysteine deaminase